MKNHVRLIGALARPLTVSRTTGARPTDLVEATLAGERDAAWPGGDTVTLPWYVRVLALGPVARSLAASGIAPGDPVLVNGCLDYAGFTRAEGGPGETVRVKVDGFGAVIVPGEVILDGGAYRLRGGVNEASLQGRLTKGPVTLETRYGPRTRARLAVLTTGHEARPGYFDLRAWRDESRVIAPLTRGADLHVTGPVVMERAQDRTRVHLLAQAAYPLTLRRAG